MSVTMMSQVFKHSQAKGGSRLVLLAIADAAKDDGIAWDSVKTIAKKTYMTPASVVRCIESLGKLGELHTLQVRRGSSTVNVYRMSVGEVEDIDWNRFPKEVKGAVERFLDVIKIVTSPEEAHVTIGDESRYDLEVSPLKEGSFNRKGTVTLGEPNGSLVEQVPKLKLIDGQNLPLNALAQECNLDVGGGNKARLAVALNGKRGGSIPGIRAQFWRELVLWAGDDEARIRQVAEAHGERFERWLVVKVSERAALYRAKFPEGTLLTPLALRTHWTDLPSMPERVERKSRPSILDTPNTFPGWGIE
jgi:hypothetical protein